MKMNILYFLDSPLWFGGAGNTLIRQAALMQKAGMDVRMTIPCQENGSHECELEFRCQKENLKYSFQKYVVSAIPEDIDIVSVLNDYEEMKQYIKECHPHIVHSTQLNVCVEMVCRELGIPHIMNIYQIDSRFFRRRYPDVFPHYHICDSILFQNEWKKYLKLDSVCIRNECMMIEGKKESNEFPIAVCAGIVAERKNQLEIIKAVHRMIQEDMPVILRMIGRAQGEYAQQCREYIAKNNLEKWIRMEGYISYAEKEIAKCDVLICGSKTESFPNVIGEAMASGTFVISTPVAGVPEILEDGKNGSLTKGFEANQIYDALKRFYGIWNTDDCEKMIKNAVKTYEQNFSANAVSRQLLTFYRHVTDSFSVGQVLYNITELKEEYGKWVTLFGTNIDKFHRPGFARKMIWSIPTLKEAIQKFPQRKLVIWGAGIYGAEAKTFAEIFFPELEIEGFIDRKKSGGYLGYPTYRYEEYDRKNCFIWIANIAGQSEIFKLLEEDGFVYQEDFFLMIPQMW